jgi:acetyltransferase-like isoleucine patch superfamily enzyme
VARIAGTGAGPSYDPGVSASPHTTLPEAPGAPPAAKHPDALAPRPRSGPFGLVRFLARNRMLRREYARLALRYLRRRLFTAAGWRWRTDGPLFLGRRLEIQIGKRGRIHFGRFVWVGDGTKIRCHEGEVVIGAKTVLGQECTISAYKHLRIGEQCVIADRAMFIDFDHGVVEVERPIRHQGIYKRDVEVGSNVWIGYNACILRGVRVGDNSIIGANAVVTRDVPANAVVGGVPARIIRMREAPRTLRWPDPVDPEGADALDSPEGD